MLFKRYVIFVSQLFAENKGFLIPDSWFHGSSHIVSDYGFYRNAVRNILHIPEYTGDYDPPRFDKREELKNIPLHTYVREIGVLNIIWIFVYVYIIYLASPKHLRSVRIVSFCESKV